MAIILSREEMVSLRLGDGGFYTKSSGLLHWHGGHYSIVLVPVKQIWKTWVDEPNEAYKHDYIAGLMQERHNSRALAI